MLLKNVSPLGALYFPLLGRVIDAGEEFEVPDEVGERLAEQGDVWQPVATAKITAKGKE